MLLPVLHINNSFEPLVSFDFFSGLFNIVLPFYEYITRDCVPKLVADYLQKNKINIGPLLSHIFLFERINGAFEVLLDAPVKTVSQS